MNSPRRNHMYLIVGRKFTGKTTVTKEMAEASGKKIVVIDTDEHPAYSSFTKVPLKELHKWKTGNIKVITEYPEAALRVINKCCSNAFVICEDAGKYVTPNLQLDLKRFIIDHRKRNLDVAFMFHFLADVPPYVCRQYDFMVMFKTGDNLNSPQSKYANWHKIIEKQQRIQQVTDMHYCEMISIDE
jgi:hypothetical protein